jgi:hypothetical protein
VVAVAFVLKLVLVILKIPIFAQWLGSTHGGLHVLTEKFSQSPEVTASDSTTRIGLCLPMPDWDMVGFLINSTVLESIANWGAGEGCEESVRWLKDDFCGEGCQTRMV